MERENGLRNIEQKPKEVKSFPHAGKFARCRSRRKGISRQTKRTMLAQPGSQPGGPASQTGEEEVCERGSARPV